MSYRSGLLQAAFGAFATVVFLISNSIGSPDSKNKRVVGLMHKTGERSFRLTEDGAQQHNFHVEETALVFLNEKRISFGCIEDGRKAAVQYRKIKGALVALQIEVFPNYADYDAAVSGETFDS